MNLPPTITWVESMPGVLDAHTSTVAALTRAREENGGGPGVCLRERQRAKQAKSLINYVEFSATKCGTKREHAVL